MQNHFGIQNLWMVKNLSLKFKRIPLAMRLLVLFFACAMNFAHASDTYAQTSRITIEVTNQTVEYVLEQIKAKTGLDYFCNNAHVNLNRKVSVSLNNGSVDEVLNQVIEGTNVTYSIVDNKIIFSVKESVAKQSSDLLVKGKVVDSKGEPVIGAAILEKGTTNGTVTDYDGNFTLTLNSEKAELQISYIGYKTQSLKAQFGKPMSISLAEDTEILDEVVVVGYGIQKRSNITSSVKNIKSEQIIGVSTPNVENMLQGKIAGVQVYQSGGRPGEKATIRIRGKSSLGSSVDPLWVVDGVIQVENPELNPQDIESLTVLKDAAATSLYGSRATSGVIVVTTKKAKGDNRNISISASWGIGSINEGNFKMMNSQQLAEEWRKMGKEVPEQAEKVDFNWWDAATQTSLTQDYTISFSGGNETIQSYISGGYYSEDATIKGLKIQRFKALGNLQYKPTSWLTLKPRVRGSYGDDVDHNTPDLHELYAQMPWDYPYYEDGTVINPRNLRPGYTWYGRDRRNTFYDARYNYSKTTSLNVEGGFDFDIRINNYLTFSSTNSINFTNTKYFNYEDPRSVAAAAVKGRMQETWTKSKSRFANQMLRYNQTFGKLNVVALAAYEFNDYVVEQTSVEKQGFFPGSEVLNNAANLNAINGKKLEWALGSALCNLNLAYDAKYFLQASVRNDASSRFGKDKRNGVFFSVSGGWNVAQENFFQESALSKVIDDAKLRVSYGGVGNLPTDYYPHLNLYDIKGSYNGIIGAFPSQLGNSHLSWEKSYETNIGLDLRFIDRINVSLDYYIKNTSGLVYFVTLPAVSGFTGYWDNIGAVRNNGFELSIDTEVLKNTPFKWNLGLNYSMNRNKIVELYGGKDVISNWQIRREGEDINTFYLKKWLGADPENGDPLWEKVNADGTVEATNNYNEATLQVVGKATPDFTGSINSLMSYKNFSLSMNWNFVVGNDVYHYRENFDSNGAYPTYNQMVPMSNWKRWEKPGDIATHPRLVDGGNKNSQRNSSRYLEDGSYIRLRNVQLSYQIPSSLTSKLGLKSTSVYVSGDNLLTFTKYPGRDPEVGESGQDTYSYPNIRKIVFGLNVKF